MDRACFRRCGLAVLVALALLAGSAADEAKDDVKVDDVKATDGGKAESFKGKSFDLADKGKAGITLSFPAGKKATVTVKSDKKTDVNLYVFGADKKVVVKDVSPGPDCDVNFTPKKAGKYTLVLVNLGKGDNKSTLKVSLGD